MSDQPTDNQFQLRHDALRELNKTLKVTVPIDGLMSTACGKRVIDIVKLDQNLNAAYADYDEARTSCQDFVRRKFGQPTVDRILLLMAS